MLTAILLTLLLATSAAAESLLPVQIAVQFGWDASDVLACGIAGTANCATFPAGATIQEVSWLSTLKVPGEVLIGLLLYDPATRRVTEWPRTNHAVPGPIARDFPGLTVPPGGIVGVVFVGGGAPHPAPVEVQVTLWVVSSTGMWFYAPE